MPYPSLDLLRAAATELAGRHPLSIISIPALLGTAKDSETQPTELQLFGSAQERRVLKSFQVKDDKKPYLAIWQDPPSLVNHDYPGSTLQRLRTQDILGRSILTDDFGQDGNKKRTKFSIQDGAGHRLREAQPLVSKAALATWLGRHERFEDLDSLTTWFDNEFPTAGTDLNTFYTDEIPAGLSAVENPWSPEPVSDETILDVYNIANNTVVTPRTPSGDNLGALPDAGPGIGVDLTWTREVCEYTLLESDSKTITEIVLADLAARHVVLPEAEQLVRRCVTALLVGHLVLQGPPGTGKTTLARALTRAFNAKLFECTATSDWSPFHVVGGLRPNADGGLSAVHGKVTEALLACAEIVRTSANQASNGIEQFGVPVVGPNGLSNSPQAAWLFIDEFNRADIDKAIGSLYTVLSSCDPTDLRDAPIDLWFESSASARQLWAPARFRIVAAMNDLDTSFVNRISQGLTRRFQFVTVGVPQTGGSNDVPVTLEVLNAFAGAHSWLDRTYGSSLTMEELSGATQTHQPVLLQLQALVDSLRRPQSGTGWPVGTAQVVDILRIVLLYTSTNSDTTPLDALDLAVADRLVPQMSSIDDLQYGQYRQVLNAAKLVRSAVALDHLIDPHSRA
ncbi:AAA family ATPase [Kribbella sp. NPDC056951]|uniref:AAA family ATPase n=1 Tax=Kribbella sp. NPDC056951 TaxID=3345978 RepID=UPI0036253032